jgi:hypothetical protein
MGRRKQPTQRHKISMENEVNLIIGRIQKGLNKKSYICMYPNCTKKAIQSHSQQKEGQLRAIAIEGMVYTLLRNQYRALKTSSADGLPLLHKIGISEASSFPGFCSNHDRIIFEDIDTKVLEQNNEKQSFLLLLRSFCYECSQKQKQFDYHLQFIEQTSNILPEETRHFFDAWLAGLELFIKREAPFYLERLFLCYDNDDYSSISNNWTVVERNVGASCSCVFSPLLNQHQNYMRSNIDRPQPIMSFNLVPENSRTHIIVSWLQEHTELTAWVFQYFRSNDRLEEFVNMAAFGESEDTCLNPYLWESANENLKREVRYAMQHNDLRGPLERTPILIRL